MSMLREREREREKITHRERENVNVTKSNRIYCAMMYTNTRCTGAFKGETHMKAAPIKILLVTVIRARARLIEPSMHEDSYTAA